MQLEAFPEFFKGFKPYPDVIFVVSDHPNSKIKSTAFRTIENLEKGGETFTLNGKTCENCVHYYFPKIAGGVAINANDRSMTALHEFSHAASGFPNGYVADLYNFEKPEDFMINKKVDKKYRNKKNCKGLFFNYNSTDYFIDEKDCRENDNNVIHPERINSKLPSLMDNYTVVEVGFPEQCEHDKLTRKFLLDRILAKISC